VIADNGQSYAKCGPRMQQPARAPEQPNDMISEGNGPKWPEWYANRRQGFIAPLSRWIRGKTANMA